MDQERELIEISGTVDNIIYKNEENGYTVLRLNCGGGDQATVVGCFPYAAAGEQMIVSGGWTNHNVHGRQFKAEFAQRLLPTTATDIYRFLAGGSVKGVGPATASLIVDRFGDKTLDIMLNAPDELAKLKGIGSSKAKQICKSFRRQAGVRMLMEFACSFDLRPILAMRLYKIYGDDALELLREDPYILCSSQVGGSFGEADHMALELGIEEHSKNRVGAAILFELAHNSGNGHCFIPREKLCQVTCQLIGVDEETVDQRLDELIEDSCLCYEEIAGCRACYLPELYEAEEGCAKRFAYMSQCRPQDSVDVDRILAKLEKSQGIRYAPLQRKSLETALESQVMVMTGGPGTGKTTCIRAILEMFAQLDIKTLLTAPTGRAAQRMTELTGQEASTIHRLLGAKMDEDEKTVVFSKGESDRLDCGAVIVDECSMVDIQLMYALLQALPPDARLIMVGDADQLPPVGPGNVFSALIRSQVIPTVCLTEIFRQNEGSRIVRSAHMINKGEHPDLAQNTGDLFRLKRLQAGSVLETICQLCTTRLPQKMGIPAQDIQVLSPSRKGETGTIRLNKELQAALNPQSPKKKEKLFADVVFREGDRVMQVRNDYDILWHSKDMKQSGTGIYNGDIGQILSIDHEAETMSIDFDGRIAEFGFEALPQLEHAWAITVHKSQGSEYRAVILALSPGSQMLMTRAVLYTAVTRAKELMIIVGDDKVAHDMIDNVRRANRYTALRVRLRKLRGLE